MKELLNSATIILVIVTCYIFAMYVIYRFYSLICKEFKRTNIFEPKIKKFKKWIKRGKKKK